MGNAARTMAANSSVIDLMVCPVEALPSMLAERVVNIANDAIASHGRFTVAFAGGSLPKQLCPGLIALSERIDFSKWHVFFGDERFVSRDHEESTWRVFNDMLFSKVPIPAEQIYTLHDLPEGTTLAAAGAWYEECLLKYKGEDGSVALDLLFCGMGPDGHTCSLFPGHPLLDVHDKLVATISDSPKPPPERVTITFPVIQAARTVMFVAVGAGKANMLPLILGNHQSRVVTQQQNHIDVQLSVGSDTHEGITACDMSLPCARVCNLSPGPATTLWVVDNAAASKLLDESKL